MNSLVKLIVLTLTLASFSQGYALDTDKVAHLGGGYICQDVGRKLSQKILRLDHFDATIFGGFGCAFMGLVKEATDRKPDANDLLFQGIGQAMAITFSWEF